MLMLAINQWVIGILVALFVVVSVMMMLIVLIQRPQGGGISEAFGSSSGSGHTAFGAKTGDALTLATIVIFVAFIGFAIGLNYVVKPPAAATPSIGDPAVPPGTGSPATAPPIETSTTTETAPASAETPAEPAPATAEEPAPVSPQPE